MSVDTERLYAAVSAHLVNLFDHDHLPHENEKLVRLAYMHGCAIMAEACGLDGSRFIRAELPAKSGLILPPGIRFS